jgi:ABC-2 type transport system permease protein
MMRQPGGATLVVLLGKELREQWRTHRLLVILVIFVAFAGLMSPLVAKLMPELMKGLTSSVGESIVIQLPEPTAADAMAQFLKNLTQTGVIALILVTMGSVSLERERGTAAVVLSKPVSRLAFLLAKFIALTITFGVSLGLAALACWFYTVVLFGALEPRIFAQVTMLAGLYLWTLLSVTFLCSALFRSQIAAGGAAFGVYVGLSLLSIVSQVKDYLPGALIEGAGVLAGGASADVSRAAAVSLALVVACVLVAWRTFEGYEV